MNVNLLDVGLRYPERLGHLKRIVGVVENVVGSLPPCSVEIWDDVEGGCHGSYTPSSGLIKLWSGSGSMALTLVHELGHSYMEIGRGSWNRWNVEYYSDPEELWARAFTQYVCLVSGDRVLNKQLVGLENIHWTVEDFIREGRVKGASIYKDVRSRIEGFTKCSDTSGTVVGVCK